MENILERALTCFEQGQDFVLATITGRTGSAPRGVGTRMLILGDGSCVGTVGGGSVEYRTTQDSLEALKNRKTQVRKYNLGNTEASELGMVCGGTVTMELRFVDSGNEKERAAMQDALRRHREETPVVYIFGGGHVSQATVPVLASVGFYCVVADDRAEFADKSLFPQAKEVYRIDFQKIEEQIHITPADYVVIMTRGHEHDYEVQAHALGKHPRYIGVMGSRHKIAFVTQRLQGDGYSLEDIQSCHMPVGLNIKAQTPQEIAVSIAGELIEIRADKKPTFSPSP